MKKARVIINLSDLENNIILLKNRLSMDVKIMAVVKGNAYGHGDKEIALFLQELGINNFAVANIEEGIRLREYGIIGQILILGYADESDVVEIVEYSLTPHFCRLDQAISISNKMNELYSNIILNGHISINTGMNRLGFDTTENDIDEILKINSLGNINITGIGTHLTTTYNKNMEVSKLQYKIFKTFLRKLESVGFNLPDIHISNSYASLYMNELHEDMVRVGNLLFGSVPRDSLFGEDLDIIKSIMRIESNITNLRNVSTGTAIGYGGTYITERETVIATIPIGYVDGISRAYSNNGYVLIHGELCKILGRVCMDQMMVDVTDIPDVMVNDEIVILGTQDDNVIYLDDIARWSNTNTTDIVCSIGDRFEFSYVFN